MRGSDRGQGAHGGLGFGFRDFRVVASVCMRAHAHIPFCVLEIWKHPCFNQQDACGLYSAVLDQLLLADGVVRVSTVQESCVRGRESQIAGQSRGPTSMATAVPPSWVSGELVCEKGFVHVCSSHRKVFCWKLCQSGTVMLCRGAREYWVGQKVKVRCYEKCEQTFWPTQYF